MATALVFLAVLIVLPLMKDAPSMAVAAGLFTSVFLAFFLRGQRREPEVVRQRLIRSGEIAPTDRPDTSGE